MSIKLEWKFKKSVDVWMDREEALINLEKKKQQQCCARKGPTENWSHLLSVSKSDQHIPTVYK